MISNDAVAAHPIDRALALLSEQPLVAADHALHALAITRAHRSEAETDHYLDVLGEAVCRASGVGVEREILDAWFGVTEPDPDEAENIAGSPSSTAADVRREA